MRLDQSSPFSREAALVVAVLELHVRVLDLDEDQFSLDSLFASSSAAYSGLEVLCKKDSSSTIATSLELSADKWKAAFRAFIDGSEHWRASRVGGARPDALSLARSLFLLDAWLSGKVPPLRCRAASSFDADAQCLECAARGSRFCAEYHKCVFSAKCINPRFSDGVKYCDNHRCVAALQNGPCTVARFKGSSLCADHSCVGCVQTQRAEVRQRSGPIACQDHECIVPACPHLQVAPHKLCVAHCCIICAKQKLTYNRPVVAGSVYCALHRCGYGDCSSSKCPPSDFCHEHTCRACTDPLALGSVDPSLPGCSLCVSHRCAHEQSECPLVRLEESLFCLVHTCRICVDCGVRPLERPVLEDSPRNVCADHPLCSHVFPSGNLCHFSTAEASMYCDKHDPEKRVAVAKVARAVIPGDGKCHGITKKKKKRCGNVGVKPNGGKWYCVDHRSMDPSLEDVDEEEAVEEEEEPVDWTALALTQHTETATSVWLRCSSGTCTVRTLQTEGRTADWFCLLHAAPDDDAAEDPDGAVDEMVVYVPPSAVAAPKPASLPVDAPGDVSVEEDGERNVVFDEEEDVEMDDGAAGDVDLDELDFEEGVEEEVNENAVRLRDIDGDDDARSEGSAASSEGVELAAHPDEFDDIFKPFNNLLWTTPLRERWDLAVTILRSGSALVNAMRSLSEDYVAEGRRDRAQAGAASFKKASIIGATVVGAARRLDALRAAEPFAVVVEEACEVMEPTLISVLAVKSLRKLELVGDHRQLPAFIQNCWFSFETTSPSIKTSLFERLVTGQQAAPLSTTILDEQRRMRSEIADITRSHYVDIVTIHDHETTETQLVGDRIEQADALRIKKSAAKGWAKEAHSKEVLTLREHRQLWTGLGRSVPGVAPCIYFWNLHENKEGRPVAGLSACNYIEAEAVARLTAYLLLCGVPQTSISIITPYKGQKGVIVKELRKAKCLPAWTKDLKDAEEGVSVSTVDRYQGDENDVIILSLVRTYPGNRFVALLNRFIVAVSRARLGFYIIGNVGAVTKGNGGGLGPQHWRNFVDSLAGGDAGQGVGEALPICCPRHAASKRLVVDPKTLPTTTEWAGFCAQPCTYVLKACGHRCQEPCHSPEKLRHSSPCKRVIPRPCATHLDVPLLCHEAMGQHSTLNDALGSFKCDVRVDHTRRECEHVVPVSCYELSCILAGTAQLPDCTVQVGDFIHPSCGHVWSNMKCKARRDFEQRPPVCKVKVQHTRPCGCSVDLLCSQLNDERLNPSPCQLARTFNRPRCRHPLSARCHIGTAIYSNWESQSGMAAKESNGKVMVEFGETYGPSESSVSASLAKCMVGVLFELPCGHYREVPCADAFEYAQSRSCDLPRCEMKVGTKSPICSHQIAVPCWMVQVLKEWMPSSLELVEDSHGNLCMSEESITNSNWSDTPQNIVSCLRGSCSKSIGLIRKCDPRHDVELRCGTLIDVLMKKTKLKVCKTEVRRMLSCGHAKAVECHTKTLDEPECKEKIDNVAKQPCGKHDFVPVYCSKLKRFREQVLCGAAVCPESVTARRFRCSHEVTVQCCDERKVTAESPGNRVVAADGNDIVVDVGVDYCDEEEDIPPCSKSASVRRRCGHLLRGVACASAFQFSRNEDRLPVCSTSVELSSPLCRHAINSSCFLSSFISDWMPWANETLLLDEVVVDGDSFTVVPFTLPLPIDIEEGAFALADVDCGRVVVYERDCGHLTKTTCIDAFYKRLRPCAEPVCVFALAQRSVFSSIMSTCRCVWSARHAGMNSSSRAPRQPRRRSSCPARTRS